MSLIIDVLTKINGQYYALHIEPAECEGWFVKCPQFYGCQSRGKSIEEAIDNGCDAVRLALDDLKIGNDRRTGIGKPPEEKDAA